MAHIAMLLSSVWEKITQIVMGLFAIIPQTFYFLYASMASLLDFLQLCVRKLAGLDVYYINGQVAEGDILKNFFEGIVGINNSYGALQTVFWALIIFGCIVLVLSTIFAIIKSHYDSNYENTNPWKIIVKAFRALCLMAIVPVVSIFGIRLCELFLQTLDNITSGENISTVYSQPKDEFENSAIQNFKSIQSTSGKIYYTSYDMFGVTEWTSTTTFSGMLFDLISYDANRVRNGEYTPTENPSNTHWDSCNIFYSNGDNSKEVIANQIDYAFKNCLTLNNAHTISIKGDESSIVIGSSLAIGPSALFGLGLKNVTKFSKFNVGLVWYYYNLWGANYFLGYAGVIAILIILINIVFGLMKRLLISVALFLVSAPIIGISPLDDGNGIKSWTKTFISYIVACFGAVIGLNLFFLILPTLMNISFFNVVFLDKIFNIIIVIAGLTMIKGLISLISSFIGGADLQSEGAALKGDIGKAAMSGLQGTLAAANLGAGVFKYATGASLTGRVAGTAKSLSLGGRLERAKNKKEKYDSKLEASDSLLSQTYIKRRDKAEGKIKKLETKQANREGKKQLNKDYRNAKIQNFKENTKFGGGLVKAGENIKSIGSSIGSGVSKINNSKVGKWLGEKTGELFSSRDKDGKPKNTGIKAVGEYIANIGGGVWQTVGDATGIKNALNSLINQGINEQGKEIVQSFAPKELAEKMKAGDLGKHFQTKQQKEKIDKEKEFDLDRKYETMAKNSTNSFEQIQKLTQSINSKNAELEDIRKKLNGYDSLSTDEKKKVVQKIKDNKLGGTK